jgi:multicomponent Na+:H+ antiporter subunit B
MPLLLLFALFLLLRGHNEPGGGFVAGLVVSAAFVLFSMDSGIGSCRRALLVSPWRLLGIGLLIALASGLPSLALGRPFMTSLWVSIGVPPATVDVGTPLLFDLGVCLAVIGVVLTIAFTLIDVLQAED